MLVKLRVNQSTFMDIMERVLQAGAPERVIIDHRGGDCRIDLSDIHIEVDPKAADK